MKNGFSLLELSIVLVIIGLIAGGIVAGSSMIRAAELRAVITEQQQYQTAVMVFKDKYLALPGDMDNATAFWGLSSSGCPAHVAGHVLVEGTCDSGGVGTGTIHDGLINAPGTHAYNSKELFWAWHHLSLAGLVEGSYTGYSAAGHVYMDAVAGVNVPASKLGGDSGWCFNATGSDNGSGWNFAVNFTNSIGIGGTFGEGDASYCGGSEFLPEEAWNIDKKVDDGMPARGKVIAGPITRCTNAWTSTTDYNAEYSLSGQFSESKYCMLNFSLGVAGSR